MYTILSEIDPSRTMTGYVALKRSWRLTVTYLLSNYPALDRLRLKKLVRGFFEGMSRVDIKDVHRFVT